jgi:signal transduction histidine kinase
MEGSSSTTKKRGLGLGLYQCRSIIRAHGGDLRVESRVGAGSVFEITLGAVSQGIKSPSDTVAV